MNNSIFQFSPKIILYLFVGALLFTACDGMKKVTTTTSKTGRTKVYNPETGQYEYETEVTGKIDTVQWTEAKPTTNPPINSDPTQYKTDKTTSVDGSDPYEGMGVSGTYNIAIMMPFLTNKTNTLEGGISESSMPAIYFYEGAKMALDELSAEGLNLKVSVMDTKRSETNTDYLLERTDVQNADLIIGPYSKKPLVKVAEFAKKNKKMLVSPTNASGTITSDNPYFIQANPSLQSHCEAIMDHALKNHSPYEIVLVVRNKSAETNRLKYFQDANKVLQSNAFAPELREFIIESATANQFEEIDFEAYLPLEGEKQKVVFVVPSYSNENFISSFLRQVAIVKGIHEVVVYGMPRWMEYNRVSYDYFENLNIHLSNANFAELDKLETKEFRRKYFERYGNLPDAKAYAGYDMVNYFGLQLKKHGMEFPNKIEMEPYTGLSTKFSFVKTVSEEDATNENFSKIKYIENKHVNILKFEDYQFKVAN